MGISVFPNFSLASGPVLLPHFSESRDHIVSCHSVYPPPTFLWRGAGGEADPISIPMGDFGVDAGPEGAGYRKYLNYFHPACNLH
jgi:hypothetical protein